MADPQLLARLDRIALLLAALIAVELLELFDVDALSFGFLLVAAVALGFVLLWGRSVFGLLSGRGV